MQCRIHHSLSTVKSVKIVTSAPFKIQDFCTGMSTISIAVIKDDDGAKARCSIYRRRKKQYYVNDDEKKRGSSSKQTDADEEEQSKHDETTDDDGGEDASPPTITKWEAIFMVINIYVGSPVVTLPAAFAYAGYSAAITNGRLLGIMCLSISRRYATCWNIRYLRLCTKGIW